VTRESRWPPCISYNLVEVQWKTCFYFFLCVCSSPEVHPHGLILSVRFGAGIFVSSVPFLNHAGAVKFDWFFRASDLVPNEISCLLLLLRDWDLAWVHAPDRVSWLRLILLARFPAPFWGCGLGKRAWSVTIHFICLALRFLPFVRLGLVSAENNQHSIRFSH
jgi:hypothetical protein